VPRGQYSRDAGAAQCYAAIPVMVMRFPRQRIQIPCTKYNAPSPCVLSIAIGTGSNLNGGKWWLCAQPCGNPLRIANLVPGTVLIAADDIDDLAFFRTTHNRVRGSWAGTDVGIPIDDAVGWKSKLRGWRTVEGQDDDQCQQERDKHVECAFGQGGVPFSM
jgi:hypothetical protein